MIVGTFRDLSDDEAHLVLKALDELVLIVRMGHSHIQILPLDEEQAYDASQPN